MALIEIDGLPFLKMGGSFHGYVSHNQMVPAILRILVGDPSWFYRNMEAQEMRIPLIQGTDFLG
jgi:hypothetical protein